MFLRTQDPTLAYIEIDTFSLACDTSLLLTRSWPRYFLTRRDFFWPKGKKLKILAFLGNIFQTQTIDGWPDLTQVKKSWPLPITLWQTSIFLHFGLIKASFSPKALRLKIGQEVQLDNTSTFIYLLQRTLHTISNKKWKLFKS